MAQIVLDTKYLPAPFSFPASPRVQIALARGSQIAAFNPAPGLNAKPEITRDVITPILFFRSRVARTQTTDANDPGAINEGVQWTPQQSPTNQ